MRELTGHKVNPANDQLQVWADDAPGSGGAHHRYMIKLPVQPTDAPVLYQIRFQDGPIAEVGINGLTHEALLAILIDRLECFEAGPYASEFNARALGYLQAAQESLQARTKERMARGVEGTHEK